MRVDYSWQEIINEAFSALDKEYKEFILKDKEYFPQNWLAPFKTLPLHSSKAILFGQDPYPRASSAIGYSFIDGAVKEIFSSSGFSKQVNRATSLRNFLKMQMINEGLLSENDTSQEAISKVKKESLINSIFELKDGFEKEGIVLLNRAPIFTSKKDSSFHVKKFTPFMEVLLKRVSNHSLDLILFGKMANSIISLIPKESNFTLICTPHPYNVGFIKDESAREYFKNKKLIRKD